jgi:hypothetical protein
MPGSAWCRPTSAALEARQPAEADHCEPQVLELLATGKRNKELPPRWG